MPIRDVVKQLLNSELSSKCSEMEINNLLNSLNDVVSSYFQLINKDKEFEWVCIKDICYIDREQNTAVFYTLDQQYTQSLPFDMVKKLTKDFNFEISDQKILVNMNKVALFDEDAGKIYFDVNNMKLYTFVSSRNVSKFKKLGKEKDAKCVNAEGKKRGFNGGGLLSFF